MNTIENDDVFLLSRRTPVLKASAPTILPNDSPPVNVSQQRVTLNEQRYSTTFRSSDGS